MSSNRWTTAIRSRVGPLQERNFRLLWIGRTTSGAGDSMSFIALSFAVLALRGSAVDVGFVAAAFMVPQIVFLLVGGVWADRLPRRWLMVAADLIRAVAQIGLAGAVLAGAAELWVFMAVAIVSGAASAFFTPASIGLTPQTISAERLQQGNALLNLSQSGARLIGPVLSGVLVAVIGSGWVFAIDGATFVVSAVSLALLRLRETVVPERRPFVAELAEGWRQVVSRRWLVASLAAFAFGNLAFAAFFVLGPVMMARHYAGAADWGLLMGCFGLGGLVGGAIALRWRPSRPLLATFAVLLIAPAALILLAGRPALLALALGTVGFATATAIADTLWHTTLQEQVPPESISRVSSYDWMVSLLIFPLGSALAGPIAEAASLGTALAIFAVLAGAPILLAVLAPSVRAVHRRTAVPEAILPEAEAAARAA